MRTRILTILLTVAVASVLPIAADSPNRPDFIANLSEAQTVPLQDSKGEGIAWFYLNENQTRLRYEVKLNGLNIEGVAIRGKGKKDRVWGVHIHIAPRGISGPIVFAFFGLPFEEDNDGCIGTLDQAHQIREPYNQVCPVISRHHQKNHPPALNNRVLPSLPTL